MKRLGLLFLILPLFSAAEVVVPIESVENNVNIRISADGRSEIVGRLDQGDWLELVSSVPGWHEVEISGGATGFISADWAMVLDEPPSQAEAVVETVEEAPVDVEAVDDPVAAAEAEPEVVVAEAVVEIADSEESVDEPEVAVVDTESSEAPVIVEPDTDSPVEVTVPVAVLTPAATGPQGPAGVTGPMGPMGPPGPAGAASVEGSVDYLVKFTAPTIGGNSQIFDDGNFIGIGTTEPKQRLEVNGNIQIHEQNSSVAGLMITQSDGETGYIMHNRASTLTIGAGSIDRITINRDGNVGFGVSRPSSPLELANGAHVTAGGVWTNSSSRARKENIADLSAEEALLTLAALEPVQFNYKNDQSESYVGFIAEDVPDLVAMQDRDGLSAMDIVAVLTKVVQEQQQKIEALEARLDQR